MVIHQHWQTFFFFHYFLFTCLAQHLPTAPHLPHAPGSLSSRLPLDHLCCYWYVVAIVVVAVVALTCCSFFFIAGIFFRFVFSLLFCYSLLRFNCCCFCHIFERAKKCFYKQLCCLVDLLLLSCCWGCCCWKTFCVTKQTFRFIFVFSLLLLLKLDNPVRGQG